VLRLTGRFEEAENALRRALKLQPSDVNIRSSLGVSFVMHGELTSAKAQFEKVLRTAPRNTDALVGLAQIEAMHGDFGKSETFFKRVLEVDPDLPAALAAIAKLRKMTAADANWLARAQTVAEITTDTLQQANLQFALGKYHDDIAQPEPAFSHFKRGNELMKSMARPYNREGHERFVDDLIRAYTPEVIAAVGSGASDSSRPVLLVGMPRSGTSLTEQIIASHPQAHGAGELTFWTDAIRQHEVAARHGLLDEPVRRKLAEDYLRLLSGYSSDAQRIVDKAPANTEYLGVFYSVFPRARIIHMRRDPIDSCLSCYFQQFSTALNFSMDLGDLAHYYRQFHRFMAHWRSVLPAGTILDVPYEELVSDQEKWTRRILEFLELDWDDRCLQFHDTKRAVATASTWQVRQKMHQGSVQRWRKYSKHLGPLRELEKLGA
jgi:tetratricopeptide (TPR) repeat protein